MKTDKSIYKPFYMGNDKNQKVKFNFQIIQIIIIKKILKNLKNFEKF